MSGPEGILTFADAPQNNEVFLGTQTNCCSKEGMLMVEIGTTCLHKYMQGIKKTVKELSGALSVQGGGESALLGWADQATVLALHSAGRDEVRDHVPLHFFL